MNISRYVQALRAADLVARQGKVLSLSSLLVEASGPDAAVGDVCELPARHGGCLRGEVVALRPGRVLLMPYSDVSDIALGADVVLAGRANQVAVGRGLLGRVVDAFGHPLDGRPPAPAEAQRALKSEPRNPMRRPPIRDVLETGVKAIDTLLTLGRGQRVGIFAGSGVGKSTLLGMIARQMRADVNVIALIGERGREVREFIDGCLGTEGLARSVVVVATADQPAAVRSRAAHAATAIAEHFRDVGLDVMLTMDSVTRFAMARRDIGLAVGEPATSRSYTPSVFAELPRLLERCGTDGNGGSITALYTVLVEGDDMNDPVADAMRSLLDGHIVLSRTLAHQAHYPAIDLLRSVSRLLPDLATSAELHLVREALAVLALHDKHHHMVDLGAYRAGTQPALDRALALMPALQSFFQQPVRSPVPRDAALEALRGLLAGRKDTA